MKPLQVLLFFISFTTFSQSNFVQGSITTNDNETIIGLINNRNWKTTPSRVEFKLGDKSVFYTADDIVAFEVGDDKYISKTIDLDVTIQVLNEMTKDDKPKFENRRVFLNVLVEGKANLYEYYDFRSHFFIDINGDVEELIYRKVLTEKEITGKSKLVLSEYKKYLGQLRLYFSDCESSEIKAVDYNKKQLQKLFNSYNDCISSGSIYSREIKHDKIDIYLTAGLSLSNMKLDNKKGPLREFPNQNFTLPVFGIAADFNFKEDIKKWSLYSELTYRSIKKDINYSRSFSTLSDQYYNNYEMNLQLSTLQLAALLRYKFEFKNSSIIPFINAGAGLSLDIKSNTDVTEVFGSTGQVIHYEDALYIKEAYFNFPAGVGVIYKHFSFEARYDFSSNIDRGGYASSRISGLSFLVSYRVF